MRKTTTLVLKNLAVLGICLLITFAYGKWAPLVAANQTEDIEPNLSRQGEKLRFIDWQPNGNVIAAGSLNNIWLFSDELIEIGHLAVLDGYQLASIAWSPDGSRLAILAGNEDNRSWNMQIWNVITSAVDVIVTEYDVPLYYLNVLWSPDGARLAISVDNEVQLRSASSGALLMTLNNFNHEVTGINWSHDGSKLATTSVRQIQIWDMVSGSELNSRSVSEGIQFAVWSPDDSRLAITSGNLRDIQIWDALTLQPVSLLQGNSSAVTDLAWGPSNLASVTSHSINIWDVDSQQIVRTVQASTRVYSVDWNSEGTQIAYGGAPSTPEIVDAPSPSNCTFTIAADDVPALINAIEAANANLDPDTICLAAGSTYTLTAPHNTTSGANGLPAITTDITLVGNGATIARDPAAPPFRLLFVNTTGALTLDDVTLTGGLAGVTDPGDNGGAVYNLGALTLIDSAITASSANGDGGGIYNAGTLTLSEASRIESNFAADDGGGIYSTAGAVIVTDSAIANNTAGDQGGGIRSVTCSVTLTNASLTGNNASSASGGGLYATSTALAIHGGTVSGNVANTGAGLYLTNSPSPAQLDGGVQIVNNSATSGGGLYLSEDGQAALTNVRVAGNQASSSSAGIRMGGTLTITDSEISNNGSATQPGSGGGIRASGALTIINSTLTGNQVNSSSGLGAGIYVADGGTVSVIGGEVSDNHAYRGGGFYVTGSLGLSTTVSENSATSHGGGLYVSTGAASVDYCTFAGNTASITGGGIYNNATLQAANTLFSGNSANDRAGAIYAGSVVDSWVHSSCIEGNTSPNTGGVYSGPTGFDATNNWWGATDGPSGAGSGSGDAVNNKVTFTPFLTTACPAEAGAGAAQGIVFDRVKVSQ